MTTGKTGDIAEQRRILRKERTVAKRQRSTLESAVVEAAKVFRVAWKARIQDRISSRSPSENLDHAATEARIRLCDRVEALESFEAKQSK